MKENEASRTAEFMALFRALETQLSPEKRLFNDPFAKNFLSPSYLWVLRLAKIPLLSTALIAYIDHRWPGARTSGVARTRLIDDEIKGLLDKGIRQVVFLGAGFDSRAYRLAGLDKVTVFEVDHPATSVPKREKMEKISGSLPVNVHFIEINFNEEDLETIMNRAGYNEQDHTLFVWEGVTNYLTVEAVESTLCWCSKAASKSWVIFTYIDKKVLTSPESFYGTKNVSRMLKNVDEKWTFGIDPFELASFLKKQGLRLETDIGATEYRKLYFQESSLRMRGYEFYRVATASI